jgi:hypothetical protein
VPEFQASDAVADGPDDALGQPTEGIRDQRVLLSSLAGARPGVPVDPELYPGAGRCQRAAGTGDNLARSRRVVRGLSGI